MGHNTVAEFVDDDVLDACPWGHDEGRVEEDRAAGGVAPPSGLHRLKSKPFASQPMAPMAVDCLGNARLEYDPSMAPIPVVQEGLYLLGVLRGIGGDVIGNALPADDMRGILARILGWALLQCLP